MGLPLAAQAATIDWNGSDNLQTVINNATSGDTIRLPPGGGGEYIIIGLVINAKNITFDLNGSWLTVYSASTTVPALTVRGGSVVNYINGSSFTASSSGNFGLYVADDGSSCTLTGAQTTAANFAAIRGDNKSTVVVHGDVKASGANGVGIAALSGSTVTVHGTVTSTSFGVYAVDANTTVTVNGAITAPTYIYLNGATKTPADFVTPTTKAGYFTYRDATPTTVWVNLRGAGQFLLDGVAPAPTMTLQQAIDTAGAAHTIKLLNDIAITTGLVINAKNITFDLNGFDLSVANNLGNGLTVRGGSVVNYTGAGSFTASSSVSYGLYIYDDGSSCTLTGVTSAADYSAIASNNKTTVVVHGDVTASGAYYSAGIAAFGGSTVTVHGNVTASGANSGGISAGGGSTVTVHGNVTSTNWGIGAGDANTTVTVNGTLTAPAYIQLNGIAKTPADFVTPTTKAGYLTYRDAKPTTVWVKDAAAPTAPTITSSNSATFTAGTGGTFNVTATGGGTMTYSLTGAVPPGVSIHAATGVLSVAGTVPAGAYSFTVKASNGASPDAAQSFTLTVNAAPPVAPGITSANTTTVGAGVKSTFAVTASGGGTMTYGLTGAPAGVSIHPATGVLTVEATVADGTYHFKITASNGVAPNAAQDFTLIVKAGFASSSATAVPTLGEWTLALLALLLGGAALTMRRKG